ncbi:MAG: HEAT repeat domain-containing protein [Vicinamibacteria bacterium]|nr:HEAT repeat domain-containing protein [Vicinamibacteria bacterium]
MTWWRHTSHGERIPLAIVGIDGVGWTKERDELPADAIGARKKVYYERLQRVAEDFGGPAASVSGDGGALFLHFSTPASDAKGSLVETARLGYSAAQALWRSIRVDLNLPVRIAVHCATVAWEQHTGRLDDKQLDLWGHLDKDGGIKNAIVVSEDVYLSLARDQRETFEYAGTTRRDRIPVYCFPASCASQADSNTLELDPAHKLWEAFRNYTRTPEIAKLQYTGFRLSSAVPPALDLERVFVPLDVDAPDRDLDSTSIEDLLLTGRRKLNAKVRKGAQLHEAPVRGPWSRDTAQEHRMRVRPFREVFQEANTQILLGEPGAGKSTLAKWLALVLADGRLRAEHELGAAERRLPLPVSVGLLSKIRDQNNSSSVLSALGLYFQERSVGTGAEIEAFLRSCFESGDVLLLLDGLDEVGNDRVGTVAWLQSFIAQHPKNRFVITSRIVGFSGLPRFSGEAVVVRPFSDLQVTRYVGAFCAAYRQAELGRPDPKVDEIAHDLLAAIERDERLRSLARNPFLLSSIALAHRAEGRLPEHRVQLYEMFLRALCETWAWARKMVVKSDVETLKYEIEVVPILGHLAHRMHQSHPSGVAPRSFVLGALEEALLLRNSTPQEAHASATEFLRKAAEQAQVLIERGPDRWGFLHLTFQEFLVAKYLLHEERFEAVALEKRFDQRWSEVLNLGVGAMVLIQQRGRQANDLVRSILTTPEPPPRAWVIRWLARNVTVSARLAAELGEAIQSDLAQIISDSLVDDPRSWSQELWRRLDGSEVQRITAKAFGAFEKDPQAKTREFAATALGGMRSVRTVRTLCSLTNDKSITVRAAAAAALGNAPSTDGAARLVELLKDDSPTVRSSAAESLGKAGKHCPVETLVPLLWDRSVHVRTAAARALGKLGDPRVVVPLVEGLADKSVDPDYFVVETLALLATERSHMALLSLLDTNPDARWYVPGFLRKTTFDVVVDGLIERLASPNVAVQLAAIDSLSGGNHVRALDPLLTLLSAANAKLRGRAARAAGSFALEETLDRLRPLAKDRAAGVREGFVSALGEIGSEEAFEILHPLTDDRSSGVRASVADALGKVGSERAIQTLSRLLLDSSSRVRAAAAEALGNTESGVSVALLTKALGDRVSFVRWSATQALGKIGSADAAPALISCLSDRVAYVRGGAIQALGKLQSVQTARPIVRALRGNKKGFLILAAVEALKNQGSEAAAPYAISLLRDENPYIRSQALELLGGLADRLPWPPPTKA